MKFHEDRCKGEAFIRLKPFYLTARLQTDRQTDGQTDRRTDRVIPVYPPNFVAGGIKNNQTNKPSSVVSGTCLILSGTSVLYKQHVSSVDPAFSRARDIFLFY